MNSIKKLSAIFVTLIFLILFSSAAKAQDSTLSYLALGDSYTIGHKVTPQKRWPVQLTRALQDSGIHIEKPKIIAKTGWTTLDLKKGIAKADIHPTYDLVSLLIGVNDQYDGLNFKKYPARFRYLLKKAISLAGGKSHHVFVVSIPDYSVTPFGQKKNPEKISRQLSKYNAINKSISKTFGVHYINITPESKKAAHDPALVASDGLHPSGKMYAQWVKKILPVILPEIKSWPVVQP